MPSTSSLPKRLHNDGFRNILAECLIQRWNGRTDTSKTGVLAYTLEDPKEQITVQLFPEQLALINLLGEVHPSEREYMTRDEAFAMLRETAQVDFGEDIEKWQAWVNEKYADVPSKVDCD